MVCLAGGRVALTLPVLVFGPGGMGRWVGVPRALPVVFTGPLLGSIH